MASWFKLTNRDLNNRGQPLIEGLNTVSIFDPDPSNPCSFGLHVCRSEDVGYWAKILGYDVVMDASFPEEARVVHLDKKSRADMLRLSNPRTIDAFYAERSEEEVLVAVTEDGESIALYDKAVLSHRVRLAAVTQNGMAIRHLPMGHSITQNGILPVGQELQIRLAAVTQNGRAIQCLDPRDREEFAIRLAAVTQNGHSIRLLARSERQELDIRLAAVTQDGDAIQHLDPSERQEFVIRLAAVKQYGRAIQHLSAEERQELEIRLAAVTQDGDAIQHLSVEERQELEIRMAAVTDYGDAIRHLGLEERKDIRIRLAAIAQNNNVLPDGGGTGGMGMRLEAGGVAW